MVSPADKQQPPQLQQPQLQQPQLQQPQLQQPPTLDNQQQQQQPQLQQRHQPPNIENETSGATRSPSMKEKSPTEGIFPPFQLPSLFP